MNVLAEVSFTLRSHSSSVTSICFVEIAKNREVAENFGSKWCLATGDADGNLIVWDSEPFFDQLAHWCAHDGGILALLPDPRRGSSAPSLRFWSQGRDGCLHLWEWMIAIDSSHETSLFLDDLLDSSALGKSSTNTRSSALALATPLPNKISTIRTGFGSFCRSDLLLWNNNDRETLYIVSPTVNATEIEVWEVGPLVVSTSLPTCSVDPLIDNVGRFAVPLSAVSEAAAVLSKSSDGSEDEAQGTLLDAMKAQTGMVMCATFLHNQRAQSVVTHKEKSSAELLIAVCYESGSIFILQCHTCHQEDESAKVKALITLPICKDPLLSFALFIDDSGGAAVGSGSFIYVFSLDVAEGKGAVTHRLPLAAPGSNATLLLRFSSGRDGISFGCWDSTVRCIPCDSVVEPSTARVVKLPISHRSSVNSLAAITHESSCTMASGEKDGTVLITKLLLLQ